MMSKCSNVLMMLMLMRSRKKMKIEELADKLGVSKRMVREYKKEIEELGIWIGSTRGRYGGYFIERDNNIYNLGVDEEDYSVLKMVEGYLKQEDSTLSKDYEMILDKIKSTFNYDLNDNKLETYIMPARPNVDESLEREKYVDIREAVLESKKVRINYFSLSSGLKERVLQSYGLYTYQGFWYLVAYCELSKAIRDFKLVRVRKWEVLDDTFEKPNHFSLRDYFSGCIGLIKDEDRYEVMLKIDFPTSIKVSERNWVENQIITFNDDNSIIFEAVMTGMDDIVHWVLSLGSAVEVLEPVELRERVREAAQKVWECYG